MRVLQLLLQFQQYNVEQGAHVQQLLQEETLTLAATLQHVPQLSLEPISAGLDVLQNDLYRVADADMDAMFTQV